MPFSTKIFANLFFSLTEHRCPKLKLSSCQLETFRSLGLAGQEAQCGISNCTVDSTNSRASGISLGGKRCPNHNDLPTDILANKDNQFTSFGERACCSVTMANTAGPEPEFMTAGDDSTNMVDTCAESPTTNKDILSEPVFIAGLAALVAFVAVSSLGMLWWQRRRKQQAKLHEEQTTHVATLEAIPAPPATNPKASVYNMEAEPIRVRGIAVTDC